MNRKGFLKGLLGLVGGTALGLPSGVVALPVIAQGAGKPKRDGIDCAAWQDYYDLLEECTRRGWAVEVVNWQNAILWGRPPCAAHVRLPMIPGFGAIDIEAGSIADIPHALRLAFDLRDGGGA